MSSTLLVSKIPLLLSNIANKKFGEVMDQVWPDFTFFYNQGEHKISSPSIQSIELKGDSMYEVIKYTLIRETRQSYRRQNLFQKDPRWI